MSLTFVIAGRPVPKKNSARILRRRDGRPFVMPSSRNVAWTRHAVSQLLAQWHRTGRTTIDGPVSISYHFYLPSRRSEPDADNLMASVNDALERAGILRNDRQIRAGTFAKHQDADRPRVELTIHAAPAADQPAA